MTKEYTGSGMIMLMKKIKVLCSVSCIRVVLVCAALACANCARQKETPAAAPDQVTHAFGYTLASEPYKNILELGAVIGVRTKVNVTSPREEIITAMHVQEGSRVRQGMLLFTIDTDGLKIEREQIESERLEAEHNEHVSAAALADAELAVERNSIYLEKTAQELQVRYLNFSNSARELNKKMELYNVGGIPREDLLAAQLAYLNEQSAIEIQEKAFAAQQIGYRESDIERAGLKIESDPDGIRKQVILINTRSERARLDGARMRLKNIESRVKAVDNHIAKSSVYAPISGTIAVKTYDIGEKADRTAPVYVIIALEEVLIECSVPEEWYPRVRPGSRIEFTVDADKNRIYNAKADIISPVVNREAGVFLIKGIVKNTDSFLKPGMYARVKISETIEKKGLLVSFDYLRDISGTQATAFVLIRASAERRTVTIRDKIGSRFEVIQGLKDGDTILRPSGSSLYDGMQVMVQYETNS